MNLNVLTCNMVEGPGFTVSFPDIHWVVYNEGGKCARIETEGGIDESTNNVKWFIYSGSLTHWEPPNVCEPLPVEIRDQIISRVCACFVALNMQYTVD